MYIGVDNMFRHWGQILGNKRMTTDSENSAPGMIYIDMYQKSRKGIYKAYKNGASLIITDKSVSDPQIPIIKVKDIEETYFTLLNLLYGRPIDNINLVGVYGGGKGDLVVNLLDGIFAKHFTSSVAKIELTDFTYAVVSDKFKSTAEKLFYYILLCISNNIRIIPINYCSDIKRYELVLKPRYDCNILIDECPMEEREIYSTNSEKPLFINIDNPYILKAIDGEIKNIVITFGLNKKAAVTATSIEHGEITKFNYCLQRTFCSKSGTMIEPFELPVSIKGLGINKVYSALAAISCALYYDIRLECIREALYEYDDKGRDFSIVKHDSFILINSYCITENDYKETFEKMQMLDYKDLYIIISDSKLYHKDFRRFVFSLANEWSISLDIKELTIVLDEKSNIIEDYQQFPDNLQIKCFEQLSKALMSIIGHLSDRDVLLILGGDEIYSSQFIIELLLQSKY